MRPMTGHRLRDVARLVRAPAALTVPGDILAGATAARRPLGMPAVATIAASVCLYWAGMALNDFADRTVDAAERPERPIPSGAVSPALAFTVASGLSLAGLGLSAVADGRRGLAASLPLACVIWSYDLALKSTPMGPATMAAARALNVLAGTSGRNVPRALPAAVVIGAHAGTVTLLSRHEVHPPRATLLGLTLAATGALSAVTAWSGARSGRPRILPSVFAAAYCVSCGAAQLAAFRTPTAPAVRQAVTAGIHGLLPLQAAFIAAADSPSLALRVAALFPLARRLGRRVSPT